MIYSFYETLITTQQNPRIERSDYISSRFLNTEKTNIIKYDGYQHEYTQYDGHELVYSTSNVTIGKATHNKLEIDPFNQITLKIFDRTVYTPGDEKLSPEKQEEYKNHINMSIQITLPKEITGQSQDFVLVGTHKSNDTLFIDLHEKNTPNKTEEYLVRLGFNQQGEILFYYWTKGKNENTGTNTLTDTLIPKLSL